MAIQVFCDCDNCEPYFMATNNTTAKVDEKTGVVIIITKCPKCKEKGIAAARNSDTITIEERSAAATKPGSFDAINTIIEKIEKK